MASTMTTPGVGLTGATGVPSLFPNLSQPMVPRCTMKFEKCAGGMKVTCLCEDELACKVMQNLCASLAGGLCTFCCTSNGICVCCCNMTMANCKCETIKGGCCITCTSGDKACCAMIEACCDCLASLCKSGCGCCLLLNGMPCCCC